MAKNKLKMVIWLLTYFKKTPAIECESAPPRSGKNGFTQSKKNNGMTFAPNGATKEKIGGLNSSSKSSPTKKLVIKNFKGKTEMFFK